MIVVYRSVRSPKILNDCGLRYYSFLSEGGARLNIGNALYNTSCRAHLHMVA